MQTHSTVTRQAARNSIPSSLRPRSTRSARPGPGKAVLDTQSLVDLFERLVRCDLTAAGYRVALDTVARLVRQHTTSEAVPVEWMGERLGLSRNSISAAYQSLDAAGVLRRIPVMARGAPTRTALNGPALQLFLQCGVAPDTRSTPHGCHPSAPDRTAEDQRPAVSKAAGSATRSLEAMLSTEHREVEAYNIPANDPGRVSRGNSSPEGESCLREDSVRATLSVTDPGRVTPEVAQNSEQEDRLEVTPPKVDPLALMEKMAKLPAEARMAAMQARNIASLRIDPTWNLSEEDVACLKTLVPPEEKRAIRNSCPVVTRAGSVAPMVLAQALWTTIPRLEQLVGKGRALIVADEIAYQVALKGLGKGDHAGGVRAAMSMLAKGVWKTPRGFSADWTGSVLRGMQATSSGQGDDQKTVH